jgi:protein disulfide isomerase
VADDVLTLTGETFDATVQATPNMLIQFYAPWCGHCKRLAPDFEKAASILKGRVVLAKVDATVETALAQTYKVDGYPTLYFFRKGVPEEYSGGRQSDGIVQWVETQLGPALIKLASEKELSTALSHREQNIFFVARGGQAVASIFRQLAEEHRSLGIFYHLDAADPARIEIYRGLDEIVPLTGPDASDAEKALAFLREQMLPPFGEIGEDNYEPYLARSGKGIVWICFRPDSFRNDAFRHREAFRELAAAHPDLPVVYTNTKEYEEHVKEELGCTSFPMLVVQIGNLTAGASAKRYKRVLREDEFSGQVLTAWVHGVLAGQVDEDEGLDELDDQDDFDDMSDDDGTAVDGEAEGASSAGKTDL